MAKLEKKKVTQICGPNLTLVHCFNDKKNKTLQIPAFTGRGYISLDSQSGLFFSSRNRA